MKVQPKILHEAKNQLELIWFSTNSIVQNSMVVPDLRCLEIGTFLFLKLLAPTSNTVERMQNQIIRGFSFGIREIFDRSF